MPHHAATALPEGSTLFVTGGSGFLGRNLIQDLITRGFKVRALARSQGSATQVQRLGAEAIMGDLDSLPAMTAGMTGCAAVIHAAAKVDQWGEWSDFLNTTVKGTENVLEAARQARVKRFIHVSSEAVLAGGQPIIDVDENTAIPTQAVGFYPLSKRMAEERVRSANTDTFQTLIVRPRFIWGQGDTTLLPKLAEAARTGQWLWFGGGTHSMSTCHVLNVCYGIYLAACYGMGGETYFLTDGEPVNFRVFLTALIESQGVSPGNRNAPLWVAELFAAVSEGLWRFLPLKGQPPLTKTAVNLFFKPVTVKNTKSVKELGYSPVITVEQGLQQLSKVN